MPGQIYCGDNLEVLEEYVPAGSVDLVYLDPPFNSNRTYNLVYKDSKALEEAFKDCWSWEEAAPHFTRFTAGGDAPKALRLMLRSLHDLLVETDAYLLAYLTMMAPRLLAIHTALKSTGSMYLHCDPTASHYLKVVLDAIFGSQNMRNEIIWKRTNSHNSAKKFGPVHDVILYYAKSEAAVCHGLMSAYSDKYLEKFSKRDEQGRPFQDVTLTGPGVRNGDSGKPWRGYDPTEKGRHWQPASYVYERYKHLTGEELGQYPLLKRLDRLDEAGMLYWTKNKVPRYKQFLEDAEGVPMPDVWTDIDPVNSQAIERTGYPTQKPVALLTRILEASSKPGDLVLDPFCGCGTTIEASERLGRRWIGVDIARKAIEVIERRFERVELEAPEVVWHPADKQAAAALAQRDKHQFEQWALRKVRAARRRKKDRGIDGEAAFRGDGKTCHVLVSVKGGDKLAPAFVRDLRGTIEREKAEIGVLVSLAEPSKEMRLEATRAGFLSASDAEGPIPRIQLVTVDRLFSDLPAIRAPGTNKTEMPKKNLPTIAGAQLQLGIGTDNDNAQRASRGKLKGPAKSHPPASPSNARKRAR